MSSFTTDFTNYMNRFYGPSGVYPTAGRTKPLTHEEVSVAVLDILNTGHSWGGGDTFDREAVRDRLISQGIINPFPEASAKGITGALL